MSALYVLRDDKPEPVCDCHPTIAGQHYRSCATRRDHGGTYYYAGQDLQGHWWMPGIENAQRMPYRFAQRLRREMNNPRKPTIEKYQPEKAVA